MYPQILTPRTYTPMRIILWILTPQQVPSKTYTPEQIPPGQIPPEQIRIAQTFETVIYIFQIKSIRILQSFLYSYLKLFMTGNKGIYQN